MEAWEPPEGTAGGETQPPALGTRQQPHHYPHATTASPNALRSSALGTGLTLAQGWQDKSFNPLAVGPGSPVCHER
jgi:hypothetical protein